MFKPGVSANPKGRPKKEHSLTAILEEMGNQTLEDGLTRKQALARVLWSKALDDEDMPSIKYIYDRIDGLPVAKQELTGADGEAFEVHVVFDR